MWKTRKLLHFCDMNCCTPVTSIIALSFTWIDFHHLIKTFTVVNFMTQSSNSIDLLMIKRLSVKAGMGNQWECRELEWECRESGWECGESGWKCEEWGWECREYDWNKTKNKKKVYKIQFSFFAEIKKKKQNSDCCKMLIFVFWN